MSIGQTVVDVGWAKKGVSPTFSRAKSSPKASLSWSAGWKVWVLRFALKQDITMEKHDVKKIMKEKETLRCLPKGVGGHP